MKKDYDETRSLTHDCARIDPITHQIKSFLFPNSKMIFDVQESISSNFLKKNLTFKHSVDAKINLEAIGSKRFKGFGV